MLLNEVMGAVFEYFDLSLQRENMMRENRSSEANEIYDKMNACFNSFFSPENSDKIFELGQKIMPDSVEFLSALLSRGYLPALDRLKVVAKSDVSGMRGFIASMVVSEFDKSKDDI